MNGDIDKVPFFKTTSFLGQEKTKKTYFFNKKMVNVFQDKTRNLKFIPFILLCSLSLFGQDKGGTEAANVFSFLINDKTKVFLSPQIDTFSWKSIKNGLSENYFMRRITLNDTLHVDTLTLSKHEVKYLDSSLTYLASYNWTQKDMKQSALSNFTLTDITKVKRIAEHNYTVYQIMKPIFIRNETMCFVYYDYACGGLCGHGELSILIKENGKWRHWWNIFSFES